jgi:hypothetical protein
MMVGIGPSMAYVRPSGAVYSIVPSSASIRLSCPDTMLSQVGAVASSKSAIHTLAPEFSALMVILRSGGPVISTRRSLRSAGGSATVQDGSSRIGAVVGRNSNSVVRVHRCRRRRSSSSTRRGPNSRSSATTKPTASGVRISA